MDRHAGKLKRVYPQLSAEERVALLLRAQRTGTTAPGAIRTTMPEAQQRAFDLGTGRVDGRMRAIPPPPRDESGDAAYAVVAERVSHAADAGHLTVRGRGARRRVQLGSVADWIGVSPRRTDDSQQDEEDAVPLHVEDDARWREAAIQRLLALGPRVEVEEPQTATDDEATNDSTTFIAGILGSLRASIPLLESRLMAVDAVDRAVMAKLGVTELADASEAAIVERLRAQLEALRAEVTLRSGELPPSSEDGELRQALEASIEAHASLIVELREAHPHRSGNDSRAGRGPRSL